MNTSSTRSAAMSGKVYDPVFLCMVGAVVLAVGTSIAVRVMVAGAGPSAAHAGEMPAMQQQGATPEPAAE